MKRFNYDTCMMIPYVNQVAPLLAHGFIIKDRIYDIYNMERNWNAYFSPSRDRLKSVRELSQRNVVYINARKNHEHTKA